MQWVATFFKSKEVIIIIKIKIIMTCEGGTLLDRAQRSLKLAAGILLVVSAFYLYFLFVCCICTEKKKLNL